MSDFTVSAEFDLETDAIERFVEVRARREEEMLRRALLFGYAIGRYESNDLQERP